MNNNEKVKSKFWINSYLRLLDMTTKNETDSDDNFKDSQIKSLILYLSILVGIIIIILVGYYLYRRYIEKKALEEIEEEYHIMMMNIYNSYSSQNSSSQDIHPKSYNNSKKNDIPNFCEDLIANNNINVSLEIHHEERMEQIRIKFGNDVLIKYLLKKQIEEIKFNNNLTEVYGDNCTICMENFQKDEILSKTPCEHIFHKSCFDKYLRGIEKKYKLTCPNCNQNLLINKKYLKLRAKCSKNDLPQKEDMKKEEEGYLQINKNRENNENNENNDNNDIILIKNKKKNERRNTNNKDEIQIVKDKSNNNYYNPIHIDIKNNTGKEKKNATTYFKIKKNDDNFNLAQKGIKNNSIFINKSKISIEKKNSSKNESEREVIVIHKKV